MKNNNKIHNFRKVKIFNYLYEKHILKVIFDINLIL